MRPQPTPLNPHSDLRLTYTATDSDGRRLPLDTLPFVLTLRAGAGNTFRASHDPDTARWYHCRPAEESAGAIEVFIPGRTLGTGQLTAELHFTVADSTWPGGRRRVCDRRELDIVLDPDAHPDVTAAQVEAVIPMAVITAYDTARAAGFTGTAEEYYAGLAALPALAATLSDYAAAKADMAAALSAQGVDTDPGESLASMAQAVRSLRLAVPSQPGVVDQTWQGRNPLVPDLLNALRNNRRTDLPYMWAARTTQHSAILTGADAYLCSDGHFTRESGTEHTFTDGTDREHYIIYYHASPRYTVTNTIGAITEICVLSGYPDYDLGNDAGQIMTVGPVRSFTTDLPPDGHLSSVQLTSPRLTEVELRGVRAITPDSRLNNTDTDRRLWLALSMPHLEAFSTSGSTLCKTALLYTVSLPALRSIGKGYLFQSLYKLTSLTLPALETISDEGHVVYNCNALTTLSLPALDWLRWGQAAVSCAALTQIDAPRLRSIDGYNTALVRSCPAVEHIELPGLRELHSGSVAYSCTGLRSVSLPACEIAGIARGDCGIICNTKLDHDVEIYLPAVRSARGNTGAIGHAACNISGTGAVHVYLGSQQGCVIELVGGYSAADKARTHLHVAPGFRSALTYAYTYAGTTRDELLDLIANLADNTGHDPLAINLGADLLGLLTDDEIALATAKNYTLS